MIEEAVVFKIDGYTFNKREDAELHVAKSSIMKHMLDNGASLGSDYHQIKNALDTLLVYFTITPK